MAKTRKRKPPPVSPKGGTVQQNPMAPMTRSSYVGQPTEMDQTKKKRMMADGVKC